MPQCMTTKDSIKARENKNENNLLNSGTNKREIAFVCDTISEDKLLALVIILVEYCYAKLKFDSVG